MMEAGSGSFICTASIAAIRADMAPLEYSASKAGVKSLVQSVGDRVAGTGVRINAILPGFTVTQLTSNFHQNLTKTGHNVVGFDAEKFAPAMPEDIASIVLFLADENVSGFIQGQTIIADGGLSNSMGKCVT